MKIEKNGHILLVDDHSVVKTIMKKALTAAGYENISLASDGLEALKALDEATAKNDPVQLIISDWIMPNMDGLEFFKACKEKPAFAQIPFIMLTAESQKESLLKALSLGVSDYIIKPVEPEVVIKKIDALNKRLSK